MLVQRRRTMSQVHCGKEDKLFLSTVRRRFPQRETLHLPNKIMGVHIAALHARKLWWYLSFRFSEVSEKDLEEREKQKKGIFFPSICWNLSMSCKVLDKDNSNQSPPGSLDTWIWPWATNSFTDVLKKLRLNNYTEERTFSAQSGSLIYMDREVWFEDCETERKALCGWLMMS